MWGKIKKRSSAKIILCVLICFSVMFVGVLIARHGKKSDLDETEITLKKIIAPESWDDAMDGHWSNVDYSVTTRGMVEILFDTKFDDNEEEVIVKEREIKKPFRGLFLKSHPDRFIDASEEDKERADKLFQIVVHLQEHIKGELVDRGDGKVLYLVDYAPPPLFEDRSWENRGWKNFFNDVSDSVSGFFNWIFGDEDEYEWVPPS